ncbi:MAG: ArsR family transcriptional regulator [Thermoplasmata archaeon]
MSKKDEIMDILAKNESTQRELWQALKISRSYLSELLKDMEKEGLISKKKVSERTVIVGINRTKTIRVGVLKASEYAAVYLTAHDLGNLNIEITLYNNGLEELTALETGKIDIAFAPIISGFMLHIIDDHLVVAAACARGGSGIAYHKKNGDIGSTMFSTMDLKSRIYADFNVDKIRYFDSPEDLIKNFQDKKLNAIAIWEPYFSMLNSKNKKIIGADKICCGAMILKDSINRSIRQFLNRFIENSALLNTGKRRDLAAKLMHEKLEIDANIILESMKNYNFDTSITEKDLTNIINNFGIKVPKIKYSDFILRNNNY